MKKLGKMLIAVLGLLGLASCGSKTTTVDNTAFKEKISTLGKNIDHMPDGAEVFQYNTEKTSLTSYDFTKPGYSYTKGKSEYYYAYEEFWKEVDSFKNCCIDVRDMVLSNITQLDEYVDCVGFKGRLQYDSLADEIHIDFVNSGHAYEITTGYTEDGRIKISAVGYRWDFMKDDSTHKTNIYEIIDYVEGEKCIYLENDDRYRYVDGDGFGHTREEILIDSNPVTQEIVEMKRTTMDYPNYQNDYLLKELQMKSGAVRSVVDCWSANECKINSYDEDGHLLLNYSTSYSDSAEIPLYTLDGWDSATSETNNNIALDVTIGDNTYDENGKWYGDYYIMFHKNNLLGNDFLPLVTVTGQDMDYDKALEVLKDNFGLTPKKDVSEDIGTIISGYGNFCKEKTIFGITDVTTISTAMFQSVFDRYDIHTLDYDGIMAIKNCECVLRREQIETNCDIGYLDAEVSGNIEYDSKNLTVNLKNITLTIPKSSLLSDTLDYQAALILHGHDTKVVALGTKVRFDRRHNLVLGFDDTDISVIADSLNSGEGDYVLELVAGTVTYKGEYNRLSNSALLDIPSDAFSTEYTLPDYTEIITNEINGTRTEVTSSKVLTIIPSDGKLTFRVTITDVKEKVLG